VKEGTFLSSLTSSQPHTKISKKVKHDLEYQKLVVAHKAVEASFKIVSVSVALTRKVSGGEANIVKVIISSSFICSLK
jgi:hypothetical protein